MMPKRVWPFGALKHRERPATHNVGLSGLTCCGELRLSVEPNPYRHMLGQWLVSIRCLECGAILDVTRATPDVEASLYQDDDKAENWEGYGL